MKRKKYDVVIDETGDTRKVYVDGVRLRKLAGCGFKFCRSVYVGEDVVVKFDDDEDDTYIGQQNECEWELWLKIKKSPDAPFFAPILQRTKKYILQKRIHRHSRRPKEYEKDFVWMIVERWGISQDVNGYDYRNWVISAETNYPIIYDYGIK